MAALIDFAKPPPLSGRTAKQADRRTHRHTDGEEDGQENRHVYKWSGGQITTEETCRNRKLDRKQVKEAEKQTGRQGSGKRK